MDKNNFKEFLKNGLSYFDIPDKEKTTEQLWEYMHYLISESQKYNLTAIKEPREIVIKHFLDSLAILKEERFNPGERVIDIGTGAGFPGLVLKLYQPEIKLVLVDSLFKRIGFLDELIKRFELNDIRTIHGRAEDLGNKQNYRSTFNWVLSRAVAPVNILSEYTLPFAQIGGKIVFYKGPDYLKELKEGENTIQLLGGEVYNVKKIFLPEVEEER